MIEVIFNFAHTLATILMWFFGVGIFVCWGSFPVNDKQDQAPFWLLATFCKHIYKKVKRDDS